MSSPGSTAEGVVETVNLTLALPHPRGQTPGEVAWEDSLWARAACGSRVLCLLRSAVCSGVVLTRFPWWTPP